MILKRSLPISSGRIDDVILVIEPKHLNGEKVPQVLIHCAMLAVCVCHWKQNILLNLLTYDRLCEIDAEDSVLGRRSSKRATYVKKKIFLNVSQDSSAPKLSRSKNLANNTRSHAQIKRLAGLDRQRSTWSCRASAHVIPSADTFYIDEERPETSNDLKSNNFRRKDSFTQHIRRQQGQLRASSFQYQ